MKPFLLLLLAIVLSTAVTMAADSTKDTRVYEMRTYYAASGKLDALHARFRDHTMRLFEKHGMKNIGYWVPTENPENKLIYILSYPNRDAATKAWAAFRADPDWQKAQKESEANGKLVDKVESVFMAATDYSPEVKVAASSPVRVFELRIYTAAPGRFENLHARFRDHTMKLFEKAGMTNFGYWTPAKGEKGAEDTLIYVMAYPNRDAARKSWTAFGQDPDWQAARKESEAKAGGSLTAAAPKSVYMTPTDYSLVR